MKNNSSIRKIMVITGTRAEYGLLRNVIKEIHHHSSLRLQLVVTGTHLSADHGMTIKEIENDGFLVSHKIPILSKEDDASSVIAAITKLQHGLDEVLKKDRPDIAIVLGDRYEIFAAASTLLFHHVPIAHIHGGELTFGAIDDALRHSITKMSWWHFATSEEYKNRIIKLGEDPSRVFNCGAPAMDNLEVADASQEELESFLGVKFQRPLVLGTFHPETMSPGQVKEHLDEILKGIDLFKPGTLIFTKANADEGGNLVNSILEEYFASSNVSHGKLVASLGFRRYLSLLRIADVAIGNSSSLVIEAPVLKTPSINIGERQAGRIRAKSVLDLPFDSRLIFDALKKANSTDFCSQIAREDHPFGKPGVAKRIVEILLQAKLPDRLIKDFYE